MTNYKVVDADQLDADLTTVADAIRAKAGTEDPLAFPEGWKKAVEGIATGDKFPESRLYCTLTADMSWREIVEANPITTRYTKSLIWMMVMGDNVATQGTPTYKWLVIYHDNEASEPALINFAFYTYVNQPVSPNSMGLFETVGGVKGNFVTVKNGVITSINRSTQYVAAGNSIYLQEIPFDILNCRMDTTEWGES